MSPREQVGICPFCAIPDPDPYSLLLHIEEQHAEGKSPFVADKDPTEDEERQPFPCPIEGCGKLIALNAIEAHMETHGADTEPSPDSMMVDSDSSGSNPHPTSQSTNNGSKAAASASGVKRLGRNELGRYYNEEQMPASLVALLKKGNFRSSTGVIPVIQQLLEQNRTTEYAYLCVSTAQHIWKLEGEGSFCGYRNIQMLFSGAGLLAGHVPDIFEIQDMIESAWDNGINSKGRIETGGVRGTRKFIGTPEAAAVLVNLGFEPVSQGFRNAKGEPRRAAENRLYDAVERYFARAPGVNPQDKVRATPYPPIYFQHRGHSMTIIGIEKKAKGSRSLLVFDPTYSDPSGVMRHVGRKHTFGDPNKKLDIYRRGPHYLGRYREFEILSQASLFRPASPK
ncbi:DUF1671-domain-containing protein [Hypoxylon rubiginosum]|uniref:DUF1671-domain-containing protein n=1 Tax=Hypoxylon rubiginosum TaxID=110542 RepID=A0ACC0DE28_9PEZI|nr:DUF1671-domain-containing protein [Hypoxylon rubiginosum]